MAEAGRIIAGSARGIRLTAPGAATRPLSDRVKQTLFAILDPDLPGASVLDLFAGSGAAGLEALSRGASHATFIEHDRATAAVIATNLGRTHLAGERARIIRAEAIGWLRGPDSTVAGPFDIVIADPPYAETSLLTATLVELGRADAPVSPGVRVVAKHFWRDAPPATVGLLASERERRFGETMLTFYRRQEAR